MVLMVAAIALFITKARNPSAYWMGFVLFGWFLSIAGLILFIAKYGGFYYKVNIVLFFNDDIRNLLLNSPIKIEGISRMITVGRSMFIFSLIGLSLSLLSSRTIWKQWHIYALSLLLALANIIFYDPVIYKEALTVMERHYTYMVGWLTRGWIVISALTAVSIMIWSYRKITIPWVKQQSRFIILGVCSLVLFYFFLGFMGPLQVFDVRTFYVLYSDFSNFNPPLTLIQWYLSIVFTGVLSLISIVSIWKYAEIVNKMGKNDLHLQRKLKTANMGAQVFTHAIKNQLIMMQLLIRQATDQLNRQEAPGSVEALIPLEKAAHIADHTLGRLDQLYKSSKSNHLQLKPYAVHKLIDHTLDRTTVPESIAVEVEVPSEETFVLIDVYHMSEAIHNLLVNAIEAIGDDPKGRIGLVSYVEENWVIIKVTDNGPGIAKELQEGVFDPFYTSKNTTRNWGVGLSYVKHVVLGHYGHIHLDSKGNTGCTFQVIIPLYLLKPSAKEG